MIGETSSAQMLIPNKVITTCPRDPMDTPSNAPVIKYAISYIGYGDDNIHANAIGIVFFVVVANFFVEIAYLITGALLGVSIGSLGQVVITLFGMSIWALLVSPIMLPIFTRMHAMIFDSRSSL